MLLVTGDSMLQANLKFYYHRKHCHSHPFLENISFSLQPSAITCLLGLSGVGKTTLIRILLGLTGGKFDGNIEYLCDGDLLGPIEARKRGLIGVISQGNTLVPWLTVKDNLLLPARMNSKLSVPSQYQISEYLKTFNLTSAVLSHFPDTLSFGMMQRVAVIRTLLYRPRYLLLDEIFTGLDTVNAEQLAVTLRQYVLDYGASCLIVTHDISRALDIGDSFLYLNTVRKLKCFEFS